MVMCGITEKWAHKVHWITFQQRCRIWTQFFDGYCCVPLTWQWRQLTDTTRRKSVKKEGVSAITELKCDENLNKTNGGGRKVIRFDLRKKCQATAKSLGRDSQIMMLSYEPGRTGAKVRNWTASWVWAWIRQPREQSWKPCTFLEWLRGVYIKAVREVRRKPKSIKVHGRLEREY